MPTLADALSSLAKSNREIATGFDNLAAEPAWFTIYRQQAAAQAQQAAVQAQANHSQVLMAIRNTDINMAALASWQESRAFHGRARDMTSRLVGLMRKPPIEVLPPLAPGDPLSAVPPMLPPLPSFPASMQALQGLTGPVLTDLLDSYDQPSHGSVAEKRARFCRFIGCYEC